MGQLRTTDGHNFFDVASALQKCIRRGHELEAVYFAQELEGRYWRYLWQRLQVISHEDVGLADPDAAVYIKAVADQYEAQRERGKLFTLGLINAVLRLCRAPKSREADHYLSLVYHQADMKIEIPDYAFDGHTRKGKKLGRGIDFFYDVSAVIHPDAGMTEHLEEARRIDGQKNTRTWWTELKQKLRNQKGKKVTGDDEPDTLF